MEKRYNRPINQYFSRGCWRSFGGRGGGGVGRSVGGGSGSGSGFNRRMNASDAYAQNALTYQLPYDRCARPHHGYSHGAYNFVAHGNRYYNPPTPIYADPLGGVAGNWAQPPAMHLMRLMSPLPTFPTIPVISSAQKLGLVVENTSLKRLLLQQLDLLQNQSELLRFKDDKIRNLRIQSDLFVTQSKYLMCRLDRLSNTIFDLREKMWKRLSYALDSETRALNQLVVSALDEVLALRKMYTLLDLKTLKEIKYVKHLKRMRYMWADERNKTREDMELENIQDLIDVKKLLELRIAQEDLNDNITKDGIEIEPVDENVDYVFHPQDVEMDVQKEKVAITSVIELPQLNVQLDENNTVPKVSKLFLHRVYPESAAGAVGGKQEQWATGKKIRPAPIVDAQKKLDAQQEQQLLEQLKQKKRYRQERHQQRKEKKERKILKKLRKSEHKRLAKQKEEQLTFELSEEMNQQVEQQLNSDLDYSQLMANCKEMEPLREHHFMGREFMQQKPLINISNYPLENSSSLFYPSLGSVEPDIDTEMPELTYTYNSTSTATATNSKSYSEKNKKKRKNKDKLRIEKNEFPIISIRIPKKMQTSFTSFATRSWNDEDFHCDSEFFFKEAHELSANNPHLEIPTWKPITLKFSRDPRGVEPHSAVVFNSRHEKLVKDELDRKKRDIRYIREQMRSEAMRQRHNRNDVLPVLPPLPVNTFFPLAYNVKGIEFVDEVPVQAFGANIVDTSLSSYNDFILPWTNSTSKNKATIMLTEPKSKLNSSFMIVKSRKRKHLA